MGGKGRREGEREGRCGEGKGRKIGVGGGRKVDLKSRFVVRGRKGGEREIRGGRE